MKQVLGVKPLPNCRILVTFSDGTRGAFDVSPYLRSDFFDRLKDERYFQEVRIFFGGVGWPEGQDLGPDTIAAGLEALSPHVS